MAFKRSGVRSPLAPPPFLTDNQRLAQALLNPAGWSGQVVRRRAISMQHRVGAVLLAQWDPPYEGQGWLVLSLIPHQPGLGLTVDGTIQQTDRNNDALLTFYLSKTSLTILDIKTVLSNAFTPSNPTFWTRALAGSILKAHPNAHGRWFIDADGQGFEDNTGTPSSLWLEGDPWRHHACAMMGVGAGRLGTRTDGFLTGQFPKDAHVHVMLPTSAHQRLQAIRTYQSAKRLYKPHIPRPY